jgi:hypothetical protein
MPVWRNEIRTCDCGARFTPKRRSNELPEVRDEIQGDSAQNSLQGGDPYGDAREAVKAPQTEPGGLGDDPTMARERYAAAAADSGCSPGRRLPPRILRGRLSQAAGVS